ncbi:penicillin-binding protein 1A [Lusitaniella coriacea LEGE 07157]|uniref:Penicillin-binding protein 1A n=1 Tax=Lusitaniella coriacea LEGE 07157 TaxID=945747 RepID=A0A8J7DXC6_9CYAN|nr:penicillin-binding protein 1A [Lusitaniella coriacea]MBE9116888.1 penicillin-binding protein 1A [Lusitaniella coriacea LEGE 07157]
MATTSTIRQKNPKKNELKPIWSFCLGVSKAAGGTILGITMLTSSVMAGGLVGLAISFRNLPDVRVLRSYVPTETTYIYDIKGRLLDSLHGEHNRENVKLEDVSPELKRAVLAIEDSHFYQHQGINPNSVGRALVANLKSGYISEGGSTITMQLVKNLFLSRERTISRKLAEAVLAIRVEQIFSKEQILEMYLNSIYWGHNAYGVQTASQSYFNKPASDLTLSEATMMAGLIQAPEDYSPFINYGEAKRRQKQVVGRMEKLGWIPPEQATAAKNEKLLVGKPTAWKTSDLPYITEVVIAELTERFGRDALLQGGMRVQTTVDYYYQKRAEEKVAQAHQRLRNRGLYADQVVLVAVDPRTHFVKALVGGVNYKESQFNRAIQSLRQPGSSFKPFAYYTAFATGKWSPYSSISDSPVSYRDGGGYYSPKNYGGGYSGTVSIRTALVQSLNVPAVKIGKSVGLDKVIETCRILGIKSPLEPVTSLPLGAIGVTPLEMAGAYATFANNGWHSDPTAIVRVTDSSGNVILDNVPQPQLVLDPWATASLNSVLKGVIAGGTGKKAYIGRPAAGKTGTTSSERDVWFVGYVPQLSVAVWIGNDNYRPLGTGITGGGYAAPIWRDFMREVLKNEPVQYFPSPSKFPKP